MFMGVVAAVGLALSVSGFIGCRYLTMDSRFGSMSFYERPGFKGCGKVEAGCFS